jgi:hypothetical protein
MKITAKCYKNIVVTGILSLIKSGKFRMLRLLMKRQFVKIVTLICPNFQGNFFPHGLMFHKHLTVGAFLCPLDSNYTNQLIKLSNSHNSKVFYREYRELIITITKQRSEVFN